MIKQFTKHILRNGYLFRKQLNEFEQTQYYSTDNLIEYQKTKLYENISLASRKTTYYQNFFKNNYTNFTQSQSIDQIKQLPFTDKYLVRNNLDKFRNRDRLLLSLKTQTGGTTGTPCTFFRDFFSINFENAALWRQWRWAGKSFNSKRVTLRGDIIVPVQQQKPPFWKYNPFSRELLLSSYHLSESNMELFINQIKKDSYFDLYAYPSTAYLLAEYCLRHNKHLPFKAVFTSSEIVLPYQRETIENAFQCKLWDWYGQVERVAAIGQCEHGTYHIMEDYSYVELLPREEGNYEITGTSFFNKSMPLIRYKTGDIVKIDNDKTPCRCGRNFRKVKIIVGRETNYIITPEGRKVSIVNHIPRGVNNLIEVQFVQNNIHELVLKIVCTDNFSQQDTKQLLQNTREHVSNEMHYQVEKVDSIPRSSSGKFIPIVSEIE